MRGLKRFPDYFYYIDGKQNQFVPSFLEII